jgi:hypothetical protein
MGGVLAEGIELQLLLGSVGLVAAFHMDILVIG